MFADDVSGFPSPFVPVNAYELEGDATPACAGTTHVHCVELTKVTLVHAIPFALNASGPPLIKPVPVTVTTSPPAAPIPFHELRTVPATLESCQSLRT